MWWTFHQQRQVWFRTSFSLLGPKHAAHWKFCDAAAGICSWQALTLFECEQTSCCCIKKKMMAEKNKYFIAFFSTSKAHLFWFECVATHGDEEKSTSRPKLWEMSCCYLLVQTVLKKRNNSENQVPVRKTRTYSPSSWSIVTSLCNMYWCFTLWTALCVYGAHNVLQNRDPIVLFIWLFFAVLSCALRIVQRTTSLPLEWAVTCQESRGAESQRAGRI